MILVKAKYLIPNPEGFCIENGAVAVKGDRIHRVGDVRDVGTLADIDTTVDLGDAVILPGFINAHTHLDLTNLHDRIKPTTNFTHWVFQLIGARIRWKDADYVSSIENGARLCIESGTTTVADIAHTGHAFSVLKQSMLRKVVYKEVIGLDPIHARDLAEKSRQELSAALNDGLMDVGLSPHAPYSVSRELYQALAQFAREEGLPVCTHIAETQDEIEFLAKGTGNFPAMLRQLRAMPDNWQPPGLAPIRFLKETELLKSKPLLIHCNYVSDEEIALIKSSGASVAFCPRSHRFFGHTDHPVQKLLNAGINVGLGTDSLASNDSLSILDELKYLSSHYPIPSGTLLAMSTINGAKALGLESRVGQIKEGLKADLCAVRLPACGSEDIYKRLFDPASKNVFTMVNGAVYYNIQRGEAATKKQ